MTLKHINGSNQAGEAVTANVTTLRTAGSTIITVDAVTNFPAYFIATTGTELANDTINPTTVLVFFGHVSGSTIVIDSLAPGYTDHGNSVDDIVVLKPTTAWADQIYNTLSVSLTDTGTLTTAAITQVSASLSGTSIRLQPRITVSTSTATLTPNIDSYNIYELNTQAVALTIANPAGTPNDGDVLLIRLKDNGTSQTVTFGGSHYLNVSGLSTLANTTAGKWHYIGIQYVASATQWHIISITTSA
jgi:hypothetical protein